MANNNKKFAVKNGLLTQNIDFISPDEANTIAVTMSNSNVLSVAGTLNATLFDGSAANLANVNASNISSGTLAQARLANASITLNGTTLTLGGTSTITANGSQSLSNGSYITGGSYNGGTAVTWAVDATSASTASKVIARDANGSFSANIITANLTGNATTAGTVVTAAQPNITSVGTLSSVAVTANATVGNIISSGKIIASNGGDLTLNASSGSSEGAQITMAFKGVTGLTGQGNGSWNLDVEASNNFRIFSVDAGGTARVPVMLYASNLDVTFNGNATANYFIGNGSQLTGITISSIPGANVTGQVSNALVAGTVYTAAQPNITSVGTLTTLTVSGNATAGNVTATQFISTNNGNATNFKVGDDAWLGDVNSSDTVGLIGQQNPANGYIVFGNADNSTKLGRSGSGPLTYSSAFSATGNVTTAAQLVSTVANGTAPLTVTSTTQVGNLYVARAGISDTSTVALGTTGTYYPTFVSATSGNLSETANANFSANLANGYLTATGFVGTHYGTATGLTSIPGANVTGTVANATYAVSAGSATQANVTVTGTNSANVVYASMADNDQFRIMVGGTATNAGFVEIATADDGTEPIYVRQYTGVFSTLTRTAALLDGSGNTQFPGEVTSTRYISNIATGTAPLTVTSTTRVSNLNVAQAGVADSSTITALTTGNYYPTFVNATSGNLAEGANAVYVANIANGSFAATTFVGALSGTASLATYATTANSVAGANVSGTVANATYAVSAGSATTAGTVTTAAQPNITSVGTLTSLGVSGAVTASTLTSNVATGTSPLTVTSTTRVSNLNVAYANVADFINLTTGTTGTYYPIFANAITGNISEVANANFSANMANGYFTATGFVGNGAALTALTGANVTGTVANATYAVSAGSAGTATSATTAGTVTTNAQPNITSVGTLTSLSVTGNTSSGNLSSGGELSVTGNAVITGNLTVNGTTIYSNVTTMNVKDPIIELGGTGNTSNLTSNDGKDRGTLLHVFDVAANAQVDKFIGWDNSNAEFAFGSNVTLLNEVATFNALGNVRASYFLGNGSTLSSITGANVTGTVANATYAVSAGSATTSGTVTTNAQPNITSVGTLTSLAVTGNISAANVTATHYGAATGLTGIPGANVTGTVANATYAVSAGSAGSATTATSATTAGTVTTNAQPNITSVGTLTSLGVSGTVTASTLVSNVATGTAPLTVTSTTQVGNLYVARAGISDTSNIVLATTGTYYPTFVSATSGNLPEVANANFSANMANGYLTATGFVGTHYGAATGLTSIPGANVTGTVANATYAVSAGSAGTATSATTAGTVTTNAQPNITSVGTLTSLGVSGAVTASTLVSNVATGTAPLTVTSTTRVNNLNVAYANVADNINVTAPGTGTGYIVFANTTTGNVVEWTSAGISSNLANNSITATTFVGALSGTAATATTFSTDRTNYKGVTDGAVAGQLMWKNYGNSHTIFDASNSTSPQGGAVNNTDATNPWSATYPTLMGWNGSSTYGVRVDSARVANSATTAGSATTATTAGTVTTAAQPNITSVGTLLNLSVKSNVAHISPNGANTITNQMLNGGTLAWTGTSGQLFSITDSMTGTVFSVNDTSGIPSIEVLDTGLIKMAEFGGFVAYGVSNSLTAAGSNQGTALELVRPINNITTTAASTGVRFPAAIPGMRLIVRNSGANALAVYPATGATINALATNAAYSLGVSAMIEFVAMSTTQWYTMGATYA